MRPQSWATRHLGRLLLALLRLLLVDELLEVQFRVLEVAGQRACGTWTNSGQSQGDMRLKCSGAARRDQYVEELLSCARMAALE